MNELLKEFDDFNHELYVLRMQLVDLKIEMLRCSYE
jgi:hypothetical protein